MRPRRPASGSKARVGCPEMDWTMMLGKTEVDSVEHAGRSQRQLSHRAGLKPLGTVWDFGELGAIAVEGLNPLCPQQSLLRKCHVGKQRQSVEAITVLELGPGNNLCGAFRHQV